MHPGGIKFGLSQGLLELNGADVVLSARLRENISEMARRKVQRRKRVMWIWDEVVSSGLRRTPYSLDDVPKREFVPFYTGLDRIVLQTMMPIAEQIQMGHRIFHRHFHADKLWAILSKGSRSVRVQSINEHWRFQFRKNYAAIIGLCKENAPEHLRHAELLALCELNRWMTELENRRIDEFSASLFSEDFRKRFFS